MAVAPTTTDDLSRSMLLRQILIGWIVMTSLRPSDEKVTSDSIVKNQEIGEYCSQEYFNASCPGPNDVIIMESARYGRMSRGRCIAGNYGKLGCSKDAMWYFERKCSGRNKCKVFVADPNLMLLNPCQESELTSYLEAKYYCVTAASGSTSSCRSNRHILLSDGVGYISSELATANGIGTSECPLKIQVNPGQRVQLALMFFAGKRLPEKTDEVLAPFSDACFEIGSVYSPGQRKTLTACAGNSRGLPNMLHLSDGSNLTLELHSKYILKELSPFVIKYESYGCQLLVAPPGGWIKMSSEGTALIGCNGSDQEAWTVTCSGTRWTGNVGNCSLPVSAFGASAATQSDDAFPYGILVVVAIGVALGVFIGGTLLTIVAFCMKRRSRQEAPLASDCMSASAEMFDDSYARSDTVISDLRCTLHDDRRYRLNPGPLIASYPPLSEHSETLTTPYDDQDVILCRTTGKSMIGCTTTLLQPIAVSANAATTGHRSLHLYETPQVG